MDKNSGRAPPIPALPATSLRQAIEPSPEKSSTSFEQQQEEEEEEEEEERPERNDVRKPPHGSLCPAQSMAHRNQPINLLGNLVIS